MPVVRVTWLAGRTKKQKELIAYDIEEAMNEHCGCPKGSTYIIFEDVDKSNWAIGGDLRD